MKRYLFLSMMAMILFGFITSCKNQPKTMNERTQLVDTVGFAQYPWQMDSLMNRIEKYQWNLLDESVIKLNPEAAKAVVCPHDDYTYVGYLYPATLSQIKAKTVIIFGVAHKAAKLQLENQIIFDSYSSWKGPFGKVKVSDLREKIMAGLPKDDYMVNDSMQSIEHSVEAEIPWLQYFDHNVEIVSILVPAMPFDRMEQIAKDLSKAIKEATASENMTWGKDYAFVISTDAVHYGDQGWGGSNYAFMGTSDSSYVNVKAREHELMQLISGNVSSDSIHKFCEMTVQADNFRNYKWTWCGRYSVPLGVLTANDLNESLFGKPILGQPVGYSTSIERDPIPVSDLRMGVTAPANKHHWVGYAAVKYN
ncbi:MAG: AmmeMemoRadiSam system protein B [Bacteroidales bacterium]|nr:AmmeMemoRadiSam system protein B [Bacteroidales bacterium]